MEESLDPETPIEALFLTVRTTNLLQRTFIRTVGDLVCWSRADLLLIHGLGIKILAEIERKLAEFNLELAEYEGRRYQPGFPHMRQGER